MNFLTSKKVEFSGFQNFSFLQKSVFAAKTAIWTFSRWETSSARVSGWNFYRPPNNRKFTDKRKLVVTDKRKLSEKDPKLETLCIFWHFGSKLTFFLVIQVSPENAILRDVACCSFPGWLEYREKIFKFFWINPIIFQNIIVFPRGYISENMHMLKKSQKRERGIFQNSLKIEYLKFISMLKVEVDIFESNKISRKTHIFRHVASVGDISRNNWDIEKKIQKHMVR